MKTHTSQLLAAAGRARAIRRKGAAGVSAAIALVVMQLLIVGSVIMDTRSQDLSAARMYTTRAFYATEAGFNMAIRESLEGNDEDNDGAVGTISNDGNDNNDPALADARFKVGRSTTGNQTTLIATGRCGPARRRADAVMSPVIGDSTQTVVAAFGRNGSSQPRFVRWNGTSWTSSSALSSLSAEPKWVRMKMSPTRNETCMIIESEDDRVNLFTYNGSTWSLPTLASTDTGGTNDRPEDVAYEQLSSDALCVYWKGTSARFGYRTYNGTSFSSEHTLTSPFSTEADFVTLNPRPASDDIVLLTADGIAGSKLSAAIWNGTSWGAWTTMVLALESNNDECYAMAFESQTGKGVAVYTELLTQTPRYRTLTGSTWSSQGSLPTIGGVGQWLRMAPDPTSNDILFVALDSAGDLNTNRWNGSTWGANTEVENSVPHTDRRAFDVLYERGTGKAILVYADGAQPHFRYRTWNGSSWSNESPGPNLGAVPQIITISRGFNNELFVACSDASNRLHIVRWNGTSMGSDTIVESNLSGQVQYYAFAVPEPTPAAFPRLDSWAEVMP